MITIKAKGKINVYGDADRAFTYGETVFKNNDDNNIVTGGLSRAAGENAGKYAIGQNDLAAGDNYAIEYTGNNLTITKAALTVKANEQSKVYGEEDPTLTYVASGFKNNDGNSVIKGKLGRSDGENVGAYAIAQNTLTAGDNYTIEYSGNNLTITKATLTVKANEQSKVYGENDPTLTYVATGFKNNDGNSVIKGKLGRAAGENVGAYAIGQNTLTAGDNYTVEYTGNDLTITKATLTVKANERSKVYGEEDPTLTYVATGFKNNDGNSIIRGKLSRAAGEDVGEYAIGQNTLTAGSNYTISYGGNTFTITKAAQTITWNQELVTGCNDGNPITLTATASSSLPVTYTVANTSVATISGNTLTPGEYGTTTVTATQEGDKNHMPATAVVTTYYYVSPALVKQHFSDALYSVNDSSRFVQWQWYKNGVAVSGATRPYYSEATALNGSYYIVATDKDGNNVQSCPLELTGDEVEMRRLKVYPNPANPGSMVTVSNNYSEAQMQGARLTVTNTSGVVLQQVSNVQPATKIKMPPTGGIYIITLILSNGAQQTVNVLVK
ncbi:MAG: MBG domain-containing protein [Agriterribacter sp.]